MKSKALFAVLVLFAVILARVGKVFTAATPPLWSLHLSGSAVSRR